jgi:hypothetical protein
MDGAHKVRPTRWSVSLFLTVPRLIVEAVNMVRCSLLHTLGDFLAGWRSESSLRFSLDREVGASRLVAVRGAEPPALPHGRSNW